MNFKVIKLIQLAVLLTGLIPIVLFSAPPISEIEKNTAYVASYMDSNEEKLTNLLKGMSGIEVNIYFKTNSADINWREKQKILNVTKAMWVYPMLNVSLGGHADSRGSDSYNQGLTKKRIEAVNKIIMDVLGKKYDSRRINKVAYGKQQARVKPSDDEGMSLDRRVIILLLIQSDSKQ